MHMQGGMMEEWHQKLHNNTSPDDVVICQALIAMLEEGLDVRAYWRTLNVSRHHQSEQLYSTLRLSAWSSPVHDFELKK